MKIPGINTERLASIFSVPSKLYHPNQCFTVKAVKNEAGDLNRFGIITGKKKISKSAVLRNRADRRIKAAIQTVYPDLKMKGYDFLIFSQPPVITMPWVSLVSEVQETFKHIERKIILGTKNNNKPRKQQPKQQEQATANVK